MKVRTEKKYILSNGSKIKLLVIRPADSGRTEKVPGVLWIHGGGYILGMAEMAYVSRGADLVKKFGVTVVSPAYRLSGKAPYPAAEQQIPGPFADGSFSLIWNPVVDGHYIPTEPVGEKMPDISADVPVLIGSNFSEWSTFGMMLDVEKNRADNKNKWSKEETEKRLMERYGEKKAAVVETFTGAYSEKKTADALFVDALLRTRVLKTAGLKADQKCAAVYTYLFAWETPLYGGFAMSYHCAEIPYVFGNIALSKAAAAGGKDAERLEEQMSRAWIQFARTGNPNHE